MRYAASILRIYTLDANYGQGMRMFSGMYIAAFANIGMEFPD